MKHIRPKDIGIVEEVAITITVEDGSTMSTMIPKDRLENFARMAALEGISTTQFICEKVWEEAHNPLNPFNLISFGHVHPAQSCGKCFPIQGQKKETF